VFKFQLVQIIFFASIVYNICLGKYFGSEAVKRCIIIIIETAGTWHEMAIELTQEIGRRITTIKEDTRETTFLFQRLSMALRRGNAVSFHNTMVTE